MRRLWFLIRYAFIFARALVRANVDVMKIVLRRRPTYRPGFLAVPMKATTDMEITLLANSITLTPGTITVHVMPEHRTIVIHTIDVGADPDAVRRDVQRTLEANILRFTRPGGAA